MKTETIRQTLRVAYPLVIYSTALAAWSASGQGEIILRKLSLSDRGASRFRNESKPGLSVPESNRHLEKTQFKIELPEEAQ